MPESWDFVVLVAEDVAEDPEDVYASVVCYSPDGTRLGGSFRTQTRVKDIPKRTLARIETEVAALR